MLYIDTQCLFLNTLIEQNLTNYQVSCGAFQLNQ